MSTNEEKHPLFLLFYRRLVRKTKTPLSRMKMRSNVSYRSSSPSPLSNRVLLFNQSKSDCVRVLRLLNQIDWFAFVDRCTVDEDETRGTTSIRLLRISSTILCRHVLTNAACSVWRVICCKVSLTKLWRMQRNVSYLIENDYSSTTTSDDSLSSSSSPEYGQSSSVRSS